MSTAQRQSQKYFSRKLWDETYNHHTLAELNLIGPKSWQNDPWGWFYNEFKTFICSKKSGLVWLTSIWPTNIWPTNIWPTNIWPTNIWLTNIWPTNIWPTNIWPTNIWLTKHLTDKHLTNKHLTNKHFTDKHLTDKHFTDKHLIDKPLTNTKFGYNSYEALIWLTSSSCRSNACRQNGFRSKGEQPQEQDTKTLKIERNKLRARCEKIGVCDFIIKQFPTLINTLA